jgi:hypothetical protein
VTVFDRARQSGKPTVFGASRPLRIASGDGWEVAARRPFVEQLVTYTVARIPGIAHVDTKSVLADEDGVYVHIRALTGRGAKPGPVAADVKAEVRDALRTMLGVPLGGVRLELRPQAVKGRGMVYELPG